MMRIRSEETEIFLDRAEHYPVIDVRSPKEFSQGHIPGAMNIPLFDDEERALVGTLYHNSGSEAALLNGMEIAGPKMADYVKRLNSLGKGKDVLVHCWRGGMRSQNMAWVFSQAGYSVSVLEGGYKSYRRFIRTAFSQPANIVVLGGLTGSGKTELLRAMKEHQQQVLDLEEISNHRGSVFGALGQEPQPTNEQFENDLYAAWSKLDKERPIWVEDESRTIGMVNIPDPLYEQIRSARMIKVECSREARIKRLVNEYAHFSKEDLKEAIRKISDKLGDRTKVVNTALDNGEFAKVADIILQYYDKTYEHSISCRQVNNIHTLQLVSDDPVTNSRIIMDFLSSVQPS